MAADPQTVAVAVFCGLLGLAVGSFCNVVAWRVPRQESVVRPGSHCPACDAPIAPRDNVPVVSWVALRRRCRACHAPISVRYPLVEVAGGVLFAAVGLRFGADWALPGFLVLTGGLLALTIVDLEHYLLPNRILYPTLFAVVPLLGAAALLDGHPRKLETAALGYLAGFVPFFLMNLVSARAMAFGDVRLAGLIGVSLGWLGLGHVPVGLFLGFAASTVVTLPLIVLRRTGLKSAIPFGPFMAAGAMIAVLWGRGLVDAWLGGFG